MSEDPIEECPQCHKQTRRVISGGAGFIFKGSGFYETDYKRKNQKAPVESSSSSSDSTKSSSTSSTTPSKS